MMRLSDGSSQKVLVPQVYVKVQPGDLNGSGALLARLLANPTTVPIAPSTDPATKFLDQVQKDSNAQTNQLLNVPVLPSVANPAAPNTRLDQLNQFKQRGK